MGIYTNGVIHGIRISRWIDDEVNILFETKDDVNIISEAKLFYERLVDKSNLVFANYIEYSNTYGEGVYKTWSIISSDIFLRIIERS